MRTEQAHLLDLVRDMLMGEVEVSKPSGDWWADLRGLRDDGRLAARGDDSCRHQRAADG